MLQVCLGKEDVWVLLAGIILCSREAEFQSQSIAGQRAELGMDFFFPQCLGEL